ncbi:hypothetical protein [Clostridium oryzae]|uniref:Uncharacterized protein n=1 Tax=Clostridium oryzae TaxID=1450648 RepID=A0A1V4IEF4_9CLOT|nr:hypothetical protein [Clostridium oryzae]OPJ58382.1 hypothetical protein CLORY_36120 [Clostridium oryzae]
MWKNDRKNIDNITEDLINVLIIALEDLNELQRQFIAKDSLISIKELKTKGNEIKKIIRKFRSEVIVLHDEFDRNFKNIECITEENIDDALTKCILYEDSEQAEGIIHNMCYTLREFIKKLDT